MGYISIGFSLLGACNGEEDPSHSLNVLTYNGKLPGST